MTTKLPSDSMLGEPGYYDVDNSELSLRIYHALKRMILTSQLAPGQRLSLEEYADHFNVSITPVRDALRALAADGLVEMQPRRGAFVTQPSEKQVREAFQIREVFECAAVDSAIQAGQSVLSDLERMVDEIAATTVGDSHTDYLAYIHLDQRFHQRLIDSMNNQKLSEIYAGLHSFTLITLLLCRASSQRASNTLEEHRGIVVALRAGDAQAAKRAITDHLRHAQEELIGRLPRYQEEGRSSSTNREPFKAGRRVRQPAPPRR